ncbi:unnamed protein product [Nippostrongylus brasiliensis]|uniref:TIL domain-containing protein n=1 Tax=Nippostrongylus brasiliensis TaxID=27835 RepID=A0A158R027_NIPBR|nr:unnamed protein product [Nippostrongylus brasiliensis]
MPADCCVIRPKNRGCSDDCELETACVIVTNDSPRATPIIKSCLETCGKNEQYNECGSACEPSCKNPKPEICTLQCVIGCQCKSGFFRDDSGQCVAKCSSTGGAGGCSGPNEEKKSCGTACEPTCSEPNPVCTRQCVVDVCQCKQAFIRDKKGGACISVDDCPKGG